MAFKKKAPEVPPPATPEELYGELPHRSGAVGSLWLHQGDLLRQYAADHREAGYRAATIHYLDASGREVNTAFPAGPDAPAGGLIDTAEYDRYGNVVRSLDATNRLLALGQLPSAATDLAALNLTQADTAARAMALSSLSTYGLQGLDLLRSRGPLVRLSIGNDPDDVQLVHDLTTYAYDEGKPDGAAYHLVTTETTGLQRAGRTGNSLWTSRSRRPATTR